MIIAFGPVPQADSLPRRGAGQGGQGPGRLSTLDALPALDQRLAERLLDFELLDEACLPRAAVRNVWLRYSALAPGLALGPPSFLLEGGGVLGYGRLGLVNIDPVFFDVGRRTVRQVFSAHLDRLLVDAEQRVDRMDDRLQDRFVGHVHEVRRRFRQLAVEEGIGVLRGVGRRMQFVEAAAG